MHHTHPVMGATTLLEGYRPLNNVSIHAPREGCDALLASSHA